MTERHRGRLERADDTRDNRSGGTRRAQLLGLTGGIASGKSTVGRLLAGLGADLIDADQLAREIVQPGAGVLAKIRDRFGDEVIDASGALDRQRLGTIIFGDQAARAALEAITHPAILALSQARFAAARERGARVIVYEAALLVETGRHRQMDALIVVVAGEAVRLDRLCDRDGLSRSDAQRRISAQMPQEQKRQLADYVIDNSGPLEKTRRQVEQLWQNILTMA